MSLSQQLIPIEYSPEKQKEIIITNICKMLTERHLINPTNLDSYVSNILSNIRDDNIAKLTTDTDDKQIYNIVLLLEQKISTVSKTSAIGDYLYKNTKEHKIIIVNDITPRAHQVIQNSFPLIEVFLKREMMFNIIEHMYVPKHILLSDAETNQILKEYNVQKKELPRILLSDPISRYYNAKIGQIFKIIRTSETSGYSVYYRIVSRDILSKKK